MTVLLFRPRFVDPILSGTKRQTIRRVRRKPVAPGDTLSLRCWAVKPYRSRQCVILPPVVCTAVSPISVEVNARKNAVVVRIDGKPLDHSETCGFVRADGFSCAGDMADYYDDAGTESFEGVLIRWDYPGVAS